MIIHLMIPIELRGKTCLSCEKFKSRKFCTIFEQEVPGNPPCRIPECLEAELAYNRVCRQQGDEKTFYLVNGARKNEIAHRLVSSSLLYSTGNLNTLLNTGLDIACTNDDVNTPKLRKLINSYGYIIRRISSGNE